MENPKVSILVPIYNVEKYLRRCIDSVLLQDFSDYELILVDDGSPDRCPQICDEYAAKNCRISVVHKKNGGLVSARLAGFKKAKGEFLLFLDGDDWLLPKALSTLYEAITSDEGIDVARSVVLRISEKGDKWLEHYDEEGDIVGKGKFFNNLQNDNIAPYLHSGIYRASLFDESIFMPLISNHISIGEDWITNYAISLKISKVKFVNIPTYAYFINTSSMMGSSVYGWEYYDRIKKCMDEINYYQCIVPSKANLLFSAINSLRFFFIPEVPFDKVRFNAVYSMINSQLDNMDIIRNAHKKYLRFFECRICYLLYIHIYRFAFLLFKLYGKKRKLLK